VTKRKKINKLKAENIFYISVIIIVFILLSSVITFYIGKQIGKNEVAPSCESYGLHNYTPPNSCHEITIENDGVRCCNWENETLNCGIPVFKIK